MSGQTGPGMPKSARVRAPSASARNSLPSFERLYVSQEWQGRRVAQDLIAAATGLATASGADQVWLGVWERNPRAIAFYTKCGFAEVGEHTFLLGTGSATRHP